MKKIIYIGCVCLLILLSGCRARIGYNQQNLEAKTATIFKTYTTQTYTYKEAFNTDVELDITMPNNTLYEKPPVLVYIHGGGYVGGDKVRAYTNSYIGTVNEFYLNKGYALVSINYTLADENKKSTMYDSFTDAKDAIRWLHKNGNDLGLDTNHLGVFGTSAGGGIATMLGGTKDNDFLGLENLRDYSSQVDFVINFYGGDTRNLVKLLDDYPQWTQIPQWQIQELEANGYKLGIFDDTPSSEYKDLIQGLSVLTYIDEHTSPILTMHGTADKTVDIEASDLLHQALKDNNIDNEYYKIQGFGHSFNAMSDEDKNFYLEKIYTFSQKYYE